MDIERSLKYVTDPVLEGGVTGGAVATVAEAVSGTLTDHIMTPAGVAAALAVATNPKAMSQGVALTAAAVAAIFRAYSAVYSNTTNSFGIGAPIAFPTWTPAADQVIVNKWAANVGYKLVVVATSGIFRLTLNATVYDSAVPGGGAASNLLTGSDHSILAVPTVGATTTTVSFFLDGNLLSTTAAQANVDVTNTQDLYIGGTSAVTYAMTVYGVYHLNLAPTATEWKLAYLEGIPESWKWGSQTPISSDTAWTGATGATPPTAWTATAAGVFTIFDSGDGAPYDACLKIAINGTPIANTRINRNAITTVVGKRYRVDISIKHGNATAAYIYLGSTVGGSDYFTSNALTPTTWTKYSTEFVATTAVLGISLFIVSSTAGQYELFDEAIITEIGATLALEPEGIKIPKWFDSSTNALDAAYPTTGSSLIRKYQPGTESLLSITNVSLAANADTTIYTVPAGRRLVLSRAILVAGADAGATSAISIGADGTETDFIPAAVLSNLDAANDVVILQPVPVAALPVKNKSYAAGTVIQAQVGTQSGGATNACYLFGFLY